MTQLVQITSDGQVSVLFGLDQPSIRFQASDARTPTTLTASIAATISSMVEDGSSMLHMEQDASRVFTHSVADGLVSYQGSITNPIFTTMMSAQASLLAAFGSDQSVPE